MKPHIPSRVVFCPVIDALVSRALRSPLMRFPGWDRAVLRATTDLLSNLKK